MKIERTAASSTKRLRYALLCAVALNLALVVARVLLYTPLLAQRNAPLFVSRARCPPPDLCGHRVRDDRKTR